MMGGGWINIADKTAPQPSIGTARDDAPRP